MGSNLKQWYQFTDKPEHIPHFQKCLRGDNEQADPTDSASYAAGCPICKSDGSLQSTKYFFILEKCGFWEDRTQHTVNLSAPSLVNPFYLLHQPRGNSNLQRLKRKSLFKNILQSLVLISKTQEPLRTILIYEEVISWHLSKYVPYFIALMSMNTKKLYLIELLLPSVSHEWCSSRFVPPGWACTCLKHLVA